MPKAVTLISDRQEVAHLWRGALERQGLPLRVCAPDALGAVAARHEGFILDAGTNEYDEDEVLAAAGFLSALGAITFVYTDSEVEDVVVEACAGRVARSGSDVERFAETMARRLDKDRGRRFEFVTVSPRKSELLAILGDGHSVLLSRPVHKVDDGTDVTAITLNDDASTAVIELESGVILRLNASSLVPAETPAPGGGIPIEGERLGARIRELRHEAGLTQAELARRTGIHRPNIARVEAGRHTPSLETIARLATAIGVPTTRVLSED